MLWEDKVKSQPKTKVKQRRSIETTKGKRRDTKIRINKCRKPHYPTILFSDVINLPSDGYYLPLVSHWHYTCGVHGEKVW